MTDICSKSIVFVSEHKARYIDFCRNHYIPLHLQPWWLDAVCPPNAWDVCLTESGKGIVAGVWPWFSQRKFGLKTVRMPWLSAYGGPWLFYPPGIRDNPYKRLEFEKKHLNALQKQLPHVAFFRQNLHPDIQNWLPLHWAGFRQTTRYTYIFEDLSDLEKTLAGFKNTLRSDLRKAERATTIAREDQNPALLFQLHTRSFGRQGKRPPYPASVFFALHAALQQRGHSAIWIARDRHSGAPYSGLCLAFDAQRASVLMTGSDPAFKTHCAVWGLFMEAMRFCSQQNLTLDFEGSMNRSIERGFRAFGAQLTPYHQIWKLGIGRLGIGK